jgi:hypothetical protein
MISEIKKNNNYEYKNPLLYSSYKLTVVAPEEKLRK